MSKNANLVRAALGDLLGFLEYKVRHGVMSMDDVRTIMRAIETAGGVKATVKDLAGYYNQTEDNIRHVIHRNLMPPPKRMVYYDFGAFNDKAPSKWTKKGSLPAD